jgi:hypothetical protein
VAAGRRRRMGSEAAHAWGHKTPWAPLYQSLSVSYWQNTGKSAFSRLQVPPVGSPDSRLSLQRSGGSRSAPVGGSWCIGLCKDIPRCNCDPQTAAPLPDARWPTAPPAEKSQTPAGQRRASSKQAGTQSSSGGAQRSVDRVAVLQCALQQEAAPAGAAVAVAPHRSPAPHSVSNRVGVQ